MKFIFFFFTLLSVLVVFVSSDIQIRRKRSIEREGEKHEEIFIRNGQTETTRIDVDVDSIGRDCVKLLFDQMNTFQPLTHHFFLPNFGLDIDRIFSRMIEVGQAMRSYFDAKADELPLIANNTKSETIEEGNQKFVKTTQTITRGNNETTVTSISTSYRPFNNQGSISAGYETTTSSIKP